MNKILKICVVLIAFSGMISCDSSDDDTSYLDDRPSTAYILGTATGSLFVEENQASEFKIKVAISEPKPFDRTISYTILPSSTAVEGIDFTVTSAVIPANSIVGTIDIIGNFDSSTLEGKTVKLRLIEVEDSYYLGNKVNYTLTLVKSCPYTGLATLNYIASVRAFDEDAPGFDTTLVPVAGTDNQWTIPTAWGLTFVSWATGDPQYDNQFPYPATLTLNDDFSVDVTGGVGYATGGSGVYSPCNGTISYTLTQGLFNSPFTVDVVLTPN